MTCVRSWVVEVGDQWHSWYTLLAHELSDTNEDADHLFMMFSATFPKEARTVAKEYMANDHIRIRVGRAGSTHVNVAQNVGEAQA